MDKKPIVSVVIPTYKQRGGLRNSIESTLNQTLRNIEVIVVDDNNPDTLERAETEKIMADFLEDGRVVYLKHTQNKNGAAARNTGIAHSRGKFIAFLDDDDEFLPEKLERQVDYLITNEEYSAVYNLVEINGKIVKSKNLSGNLLMELLTERTAMFTSALMFRKESLEKIGGFNENFRRHQDYEIMVKFFAEGFSVGCLPIVLTQYSTKGGNNVSGKALEMLKQQFLSQFENIIKNLDEKEKGARNEIIGSNYAYVFISHIANRDFLLAIKLLIKYTLYSPRGFYSYFWYFLKTHINNG